MIKNMLSEFKKFVMRGNVIDMLHRFPLRALKGGLHQGEKKEKLIKKIKANTDFPINYT